MTTVLYLGRDEDGDGVVSGLHRAAPRFDVDRADPRTMTGRPAVDCLVTTADATVDGRPVAALARATGYRGPVVLLGAGSHESLAARCEAVGATTYVRREGDDTASLWTRLGNAIDRAVARTARRHERDSPVAELAHGLAGGDDESAIGTTVVEAVGGRDGAAAIVADADDENATHENGRGGTWRVLAASEEFALERLTRPDVVAALDEGTTAFVADEERPWPDGEGVVVVPAGSAWRLVVDAVAIAQVGVEAVQAAASVAELALERAANETRLQRERDRFASLYQNTSDAIVDIDYADGEPLVRDVNATFERLFGYEREAVVGTNLDDHILPEGAEGVETEWWSRTGSGEPAEAEVRRVTADGVRDFLLRSIPFDGERTTRGYAIYTDITERKRSERILGRLHETTRQLMQAADEDDIADITVRAATDILGYPVTAVRFHDAATGQLRLAAVSNETDVILGERPVDSPEVDIAREAFETGTPRVVDDLAAHGVTGVGIKRAMYLPLGDRGLLTLGSPVAARFDESDRRLAQILAANVTVSLARAARIRTLQRREDELARQNERLESFASVVSHDLRNPLSVARGYLDLAREGCVEGDEDPTPHFERVEHAHERMNRLITDLLALARQGRSVGETETVDLEPIAAEAWEAVETDGAVLDVVETQTVAADAERLKTLFENLFRNSVEHGSTSPRSHAREDSVEHGSTDREKPTDSAVVHVRVGGLDDGFFVEDDGPGIPPEDRDIVFERGYSTGTSGTGFGLSIVREIVEAHGWTISATESASGGARFEIHEVDTVRHERADSTS